MVRDLTSFPNFIFVCWRIHGRRVIVARDLSSTSDLYHYKKLHQLLPRASPRTGRTCLWQGSSRAAGSAPQKDSSQALKAPPSYCDSVNRLSITFQRQATSSQVGELHLPPRPGEIGLYETSACHRPGKQFVKIFTKGKCTFWVKDISNLKTA